MTKRNLLVRLVASAVIVLCADLSISGSVPAQDVQGNRTAAMKQLIDSRACVGCDLTGAMFLKGTDLSGVNLSGASLVGAGFYGVKLKDANLAGADLSKATLSFANFENANLGGAKFDGANLAGSTGAALAGSVTTETTTCPDGTAGPCR